MSMVGACELEGQQNPGYPNRVTTRFTKSIARKEMVVSLAGAAGRTWVNIVSDATWKSYRDIESSLEIREYGGRD